MIVAPVLVSLVLLLVSCATDDGSRSEGPTLPTSTVAPVTGEPTTGPSPTATAIPTASPDPIPRISTTPAFPLLPEDTFGRRPLLLTYPPDGTNRVVVVEQDGPVHIFENSPDVTESVVYFDLSDQVSRSGNEEGFLGLVFHPDYAVNGQLYVYYSAADPRRSILSRFKVSPDPNRVEIDSEQIILEIPEPHSNHNGGAMAFGPDGYLYIGIGDGGSSNDPDGNGQDPSTLLGTIIRIDVNSTGESLEYGIPADNPFATSPNGERPEIWAYGLRNPWRISFDSETGHLWVGDVGQNVWEEIDLVERGGNYGWNTLEGTHCFRPSSGCDSAGSIPPVAEYNHGFGCSVTGGFVYRGTELADLQGVYIYGDFCSGNIWGFRTGSAEAVDPGSAGQLIGAANGQISSFGEDSAGNLFVIMFQGQVHRIKLTE